MRQIKGRRQALEGAERNGVPERFLRCRRAPSLGGIRPYTDSHTCDSSSEGSVPLHVR